MYPHGGASSERRLHTHHSPLSTLNSNMIHVIATIKIAPGKRQEFLGHFNANVPDVLAEQGCIEYMPAIDAATDISVQSTDENEVIVIEKWESLEALNAHLVAPHMQTYKEKVTGLVAGLTLRVLEKAI